jgi:hypothetical protein
MVERADKSASRGALRSARGPSRIARALRALTAPCLSLLLCCAPALDEEEDSSEDSSEDGLVSKGVGGTTSCATAKEGRTVSLSCPSGQTISRIDFASYGTPSGTCGSQREGTCHDPSSRSTVEERCVDGASCSFVADNSVFEDRCEGVAKSLAVQYTCEDGGSRAAGGSGADSYQGTGELLPVKDHMLAECDEREKVLLRREGFTRVKRVSIGEWRDIVTIQASSLITQELVDAVAKESRYVLKPLIRRYPDRMKQVLDFNKGAINIVLVFGTGELGLTGGMGDEGMVFKRNGTQDGGLFHEWGHLLDIHDTTPRLFRDHAGSIFSADDAAVFDRSCFNDPLFINPDGSCQYSEFVAEKYREMFYAQSRALVEKNTPEVYTRMLNYVPTPSSYVPFKGVYFYDMPDCPTKCLLGNE